MLSYQHLFHAGNLADVQKHALLAWVLDYLIQKDKPLSYIETHAGRGIYDLGAEEAIKTGEAEKGIAVAEALFPKGHPYLNRLNEVRASYGPMAYPGSPLIAALSLRDQDTIHLAELHPQEHQHLRHAMNPWETHIYQRDGFDLALALTPPSPRRGLMLIDPSYEVKVGLRGDSQAHRQYRPQMECRDRGPVVSPAARRAACRDAAGARRAIPRGAALGGALSPVREGHRMEGSGMFVVNPPYGMAEEARRIEAIFKRLHG